MRIKTPLSLAALAAWAAAIVCFGLLAASDNSSIAIPRLDAAALDAAPGGGEYRGAAYPDIARLTSIDAIESEDDLLAVARWVRSRMTLDLEADALPRHPAAALDRAAAAPVRGFCSNYSMLTVAAAHAYGLPARVVQVKGHATSEVYLGGRWRIVDTYFNILGEGSALELMRSGDFSTLRKIDDDSPDDIDWEPEQMRDAFQITPEWPPFVFTARATFQDLEPRSALRRALDAALLQPPLKYTLRGASPWHPALVAAIWRRGFQFFTILALALTLGAIAAARAPARPPAPEIPPSP